MLYDVSHLYCIDFGDFPQSHIYFGSIFFLAENIMLVFGLSGSYGTQNGAMSTGLER
jgi:hypothetical protein